MCKVLDEAVVVVGKAKELLHTLDVGGWLPVSDSGHLVHIDAEFARANNMAEVLHARLPKLALLELRLQLMLPQTSKHFAQMLFMSVRGVTIDQYVVQVHQNKVIDVTRHHSVHQPLKRTGRVAEAEG